MFVTLRTDMGPVRFNIDNIITYRDHEDGGAIVQMINDVHYRVKETAARIDGLMEDMLG